MKDRGRKQVCYVCSRNVVFDTPEKDATMILMFILKCLKNTILNVLTQIMNDYPAIDFVTIQGETYGEGIQKRNYNLENHLL